MKHAVKITLIVLLMLGLVSAADAQTKFRAFTALTGGGTGALDKIAVADLTDGDIGFVTTATNFYVFRFDATATDAESSPTKIRPDDYATAGVWELIGLYGVTIQSGPSATPSLDFYDSDATDNDINAQVYVNCTDAGSNAEDCDIYIKAQVAGTLTTKIQIDADGNIILSDDLLVSDDLKVYFRDTAIYINSGADGYLDLEADTGIRFNAPVTLANEGSITAGGIILGDSTPDAEGELGYGSNQLSVHDGTASRPLLQIASTLITKSEYIPIRYAEADDTVTAPADAAEISTTTAIGRAFDAATEEGVVIWWNVPLDYSAGIKFRVYYALMADASADNTVVFGLSGCSVGNSEAIACSEGTAVTKADELGTDDDQYQMMVSDWSDAVTVTGIAVGEMAKLLFYRDADAAADDYGSDVSVIGIEIKYQAKVNASSDY